MGQWGDNFRFAIYKQLLVSHVSHISHVGPVDPVGTVGPVGTVALVLLILQFRLTLLAVLVNWAMQLFAIQLSIASTELCELVSEVFINSIIFILWYFLSRPIFQLEIWLIYLKCKSVLSSCWRVITIHSLFLRLFFNWKTLPNFLNMEIPQVYREVLIKRGQNLYWAEVEVEQIFEQLSNIPFSKVYDLMSLIRRGSFK